MRDGTGARRPRRNVPALALSGFFLFILAEVALLVWVSTIIGWWMLPVMMVSTIVGAYLLQREWRKAWHQLGDSLTSGSLPSGRAADAVLVLMGGFMLIMPGFITDVLGLLLLLPFTRPGVRSVLGSWVARAVRGDATTPRTTVIRGEVVESESSPLDFTILEISPEDPEDS